MIMGPIEQHRCSGAAPEEGTLPKFPLCQLRIERGFEAIREHMRACGVDPGPQSRVAFGDAEPTCTELQAGSSRVALVQIWEVGGKYTVQLHIYDPTHPSAKPLQEIERLAECVLTPKQRLPLANCIADKLTWNQLEAFTTRIEALARAKHSS